MCRAIDLARMGLGSVSPNPMVGCVVVKNGTIIGEGWHKEFGGPHAEVNALRAISHPDMSTESTVYVNLEPCSFYGKTPPCTDLLIKSKVKEVVISTGDPNPKVAGTGVKKLLQHGIKVIENVLHNEGRELNRRFFTNQELERPYVILKWAQTSDGFIAREDYSSKWISSEDSRKLVHKWRAEEDSILVGRNTVQHDNPMLNVRNWRGSSPIRVVIDPNNKLPDGLNIHDRSVQTLIYNFKKNEQSENLAYVNLKNSENFLQSLLTDLLNRGVGSVIVEGGANTIQGFVNSELWDEARVFTSKLVFKKGIPAPDLKSELATNVESGGDLLEIFENGRK